MKFEVMCSFNEWHRIKVQEISKNLLHNIEYSVLELPSFLVTTRFNLTGSSFVGLVVPIMKILLRGLPWVQFHAMNHFRTYAEVVHYFTNPSSQWTIPRVPFSEIVKTITLNSECRVPEIFFYLAYFFVVIHFCS